MTGVRSNDALLRGTFIALGLASALVVGGAAPARAATPLTIQVRLWSGVFGGTGTAGLVAHVTVFDAGAHQKCDADPVVGDGGHWFITACDALDQVVVPGDKIQVIQGRTIHRLTLPLMSVRVARDTDRATGSAPAGSTIALSAYQCTTYDSLCSVEAQATATASSTGRWSRDLSAQVNLRGGDGVAAEWTSPGGDTVSISGAVPFSQATLGSAVVGISASGNQAVALVLRDADGHLRGTGAATTWFYGYVEVTLRDAHGDVTKVHAGDRLAGDFTTQVVKVPPLTVAGTASTDKVTGWCGAGRAWSLRATRTGGSPSARFTGVAGGQGHVSVTTTSASPSYDLKHGDRLVLTCRLTSGDEVRVRATVP